ncbi:nuclear transport factor 2 family protein [Massilia oculi]|uniref:Nuclear transport factor 2 family protein n=1 Tax=Massilia hydrophila TaxID=3044279 RepID=A0ABS7Y5G1_9BURK|nr:nuclear transport factor 2 family protein [Massilia oculi]MCA1854918.1 nuclear transport factor 2 family protein [Massilia oculi]
MPRLLAAAILCLGFLGVLNTARAAPADPALASQVNAFVDAWHDDAAHARMAYFDKIAPDGVYIGTDRTELWQRDAFKAWARKYFERKSAWNFKATRRNVYASADKSLIWFDELLDTPNMGPCMASGVIRKTATGFEIVHYQLSMAVPNELAGQVTKLIATGK